MMPDVIVNIRFFTQSEGGRATSVTENSLSYYSAPMLIDNQYFDCRIILDGKGIVLGKHYELPITFLCRDDALQRITLGKEVSLWEGKIIAKAEIIDIIDKQK